MSTLPARRPTPHGAASTVDQRAIHATSRYWVRLLFFQNGVTPCFWATSPFSLKVDVKKSAKLLFPNARASPRPNQPTWRFFNGRVHAIPGSLYASESAQKGQRVCLDRFDLSGARGRYGHMTCAFGHIRSIQGPPIKTALCESYDSNLVLPALHILIPRNLLQSWGTNFSWSSSKNPPILRVQNHGWYLCWGIESFCWVSERHVGWISQPSTGSLRHTLSPTNIATVGGYSTWKINVLLDEPGPCQVPREGGNPSALHCFLAFTGEPNHSKASEQCEGISQPPTGYGHGSKSRTPGEHPNPH